MLTVTRKFTVSTHKGKGPNAQEVELELSYAKPTTREEIISAVQGDDNLVKFVANELERKAFAAGKNKVYNYALTGADDTEAARAKCVSDAIAATRDYAWSERGQSDKARVEAAREIAARGGSREELLAALGLA